MVDSLKDVPTNGFGYQYAELNQGYIGLETYGQAGISDEYRAYAGTQLLEAMYVDTQYFVSFETCLALEGFYWPMNHASDNIGVVFTMTGYDWLDSPQEIPNEAHLYATEIIEDTLNWTHIEGIFTADEPYTHIGVGNFFDSANTEYIQYQNGLGAYYYVDNVVVMKLSNYNHVSGVSTRPELQTLQQGCKYFFSFPDKRGDASLFDLNGKLIWTIPYSQQLTVDLSAQHSGVYLLKIATGKNNQFIYKLIKS
ncbi:MAG: T9SS type A sorting domain-containing protein [Flavobacteriales bacterium]|nr:T9SS type A sorting domain-containing protein [Flavobacteriales bacterium]